MTLHGVLLIHDIDDVMKFYDANAHCPSCNDDRTVLCVGSLCIRAWKCPYWIPRSSGDILSDYDEVRALRKRRGILPEVG